jgi:hypothetical protein
MHVNQVLVIPLFSVKFKNFKTFYAAHFAPPRKDRITEG